MKQSKLIALSAISAAFAVVLLALGAFIEVIDISCVMLAGLAIMLPLAKKSYIGAFLSYAASALLALILTSARFTVIVPYAMFFGLHPIANALQEKYKINRIVAVIVKDVWFLLSMFVYYKLLVALSGYDLFADFAMIPDSFKPFLAPALFVFGGIFFVFYDMVMVRMQRLVDYVVYKLKF